VRARNGGGEEGGRRQPPALLAADLDGTLLFPDRSFDPSLPDVLARLRARGVAVVPCTGRMLRSARPVAARLGLREGPVVCYQGALVAELGDGAWLRHQPVPSPLAVRVVEDVRRLGLHLNAYVDDELVVERLDEWARRYAEYAEVGITAVDDLAALVRERPPTKFVVLAPAAEVPAVVAGLRRRWGGRLTVNRSQPEYVEVTAAGVSKSAALAWLCRRLGVPQEAVVACGDGMNDIDLLRWAGLGVAVAEADADVRAAADVVVPRAGLARFLDGLA